MKPIYWVLLAFAAGWFFAKAPPLIPESATVPYPRNFTRDQLVVSDYDNTPNVVRVFYTIPATQDLYLDEASDTMQAPDGSQVWSYLYFRPPGESDGVIGMCTPRAPLSKRYNARPVCIIGGTTFSIYINGSGPLTRHHAQIIGVLKNHDPGLWTGGPGYRFVNSAPSLPDPWPGWMLLSTGTPESGTIPSNFSDAILRLN